MISKTTVAKIILRYPIIAKVIKRVYRMTRSRYTAGVNGVLFNEAGQVLLVKHVFHPEHPWGFPGGWVDRMEDPGDAVVREFDEETTLKVEIVRPVVVLKGQHWGSHLDIAYLLHSHSPLDSIEISAELLEYGWFALDDLPPMSRFSNRIVEVLRTQKELMKR